MDTLRVRLTIVSAILGVLASGCTPEMAPSGLGAKPRPGAKSLDWRRIDHPSLRATQRNFFVNGLSPGDADHPWFAAGFEVSPSGRRQPVIWRSPDGRVWQREPVEELSGGDRLFDVARHGETTVTFGLSPQSDGFQPSVMWRRDAGGTWRPEAGIDGQFGSFPDGGLEGVVSTPDGFLAFGQFPGVGGAPGSVGVWRSTDGSNWEAEMDLVRQHDPADISRAWGAVAHGAVTVVVGERFDAVPAPGQEGPTRTQADGAIWTEIGGEWTSVAVGPAELGGDGFQQVADVDWFQGRFVAVGRQQDGVDRPPQPAMWTSRDGLRWRLVDGPSGATAVSGAALSALEVVDQRLVVAGEVDSVPSLWTSENGLDWRPEPLPAAVSTVQGLQLPILLAANRGRLLIAVNGESQAQLWARAGGRWLDVTTSPAFPSPGTTLEVSDIAHGEAGYVVVGNESMEGASVTGRVWVSHERFQPADGPFASSDLAAVASSPNGYVIAGTVWDSGLARAASWYSVDGRTWRRTFVQERPRTGSAVGIVSQAAGWILLMNGVTRAGNRISAWVSKDGLNWRSAGTVGQQGEVGAGLCASDSDVMAIGLRPGADLGVTLAWRLEEGGRWRKRFEGVSGAPRACATSDAGEVVLIDADVAGPQLWHRQSGGDWGRGSMDASVQTRVLDVTAFDRGFLAVGSETTAGNEDFRLWTSADGSAWMAEPGPTQALAEPGLQRGMAVASDDEAVIAGGYFSTGAALWLGPAP